MYKISSFPSKVAFLLLSLMFLLTGIAEAQEVQITSPRNGDEVGTYKEVKGKAELPVGHHVWVLARRHDFTPLWWPQEEAKVDSKTHEWSAIARFGLKVDIDHNFDIGVITVDEKGHEKLMQYRAKALESGDWRPISIDWMTSAPRVITVKKVRHEGS